MKRNGPRLLEERLIVGDVVGECRVAPGEAPPAGRTATARRSVTVNLAEAPLGWLFARGHVTRRQYLAGERLRIDWERSCLDPRATMRWDADPLSSGGGAGGPGLDLTMAQLDARRRFELAVESAGAGLSDILWRIVCAGEGMRDAERALGWPVRAGKLVLTIALDRVADHYRMPLDRAAAPA